MKNLILSALTLSLAFSAPFASANDRHDHRKPTFNSHYNHSRNYHDNHRNKPVYHHRSHDAKAGYLLGGLVLGAVINEIASAPRSTVVRETVVVDREPVYTRQQEVQYLKDEYGDCYRVDYNNYGRVLTDVSNRFCSAR